MSISTVVRLPTAAGIFIGRFTEQGLAELWFPERGPLSRAIEIARAEPSMRDWMNTTLIALGSVLEGASGLPLPPLDWTGQTTFRKRVWTELIRIPAGKTLTYGEVAAAIGSASATRAVGAACGANPIPVLVPCHRVLAAGGALGGFSGGLEWKRRLLAIENPRDLRLASPA